MARGKEPEEVSMERYAALLDQITSAPFDKQLHLQHIDLTKKLGDEQGLEDARNMMATYFPLPEGEPSHHCTDACRLTNESRVAAMWLEWIASRKEKVAAAPADDMTAHVELLELYKRANDDYLCTLALVLLS